MRCAQKIQQTEGRRRKILLTRLPWVDRASSSLSSNRRMTASRSWLFASSLPYGTNQLVPLLLQPLEFRGVRDHLGSSINHLSVGGGELLSQLFTLSCLFGMTVPTMIHEGL
jgi:hypothetical protein